jgi:hypothetical protein
MIVATVNLEIQDAINRDLFLRSLYPNTANTKADIDKNRESEEMIIDRVLESSRIDSVIEEFTFSESMLRNTFKGIACSISSNIDIIKKNRPIMNNEMFERVTNCSHL